MEVSVIIASRNHAQFLGRCLRSLFSQKSAPAFEIIVFDDGSTDSTRAILEAFQGEIKYLRSDNNIGLPAALNRAINQAKGDYVVRVDSDDYVSENFLQVLHMAVSRNPKIDAVSCDYVVFSDTDPSISEIRSAVDEKIACGIMFRKSALLEVGLYDEHFRSHEDKELMRRFEKSRKVSNIPIPLYRYRRHANNMTANAETMEFYWEKLIGKHGS